MKLGYVSVVSHFLFSGAQRIVYDGSLILGFTTGRILLVSEELSSGFKLQRNASILNPLFAGASDRGSLSGARALRQRFAAKKSPSASRRPITNSPRTAKPLKPYNLCEPLPTEEFFPSFEKSGCRDLNPLEEGTPLFQRVFEESLSSSKRILPTYSEQRKTHP